MGSSRVAIAGEVSEMEVGGFGLAARVEARLTCFRFFLICDAHHFFLGQLILPHYDLFRIPSEYFPFLEPLNYLSHAYLLPCITFTSTFTLSWLSAFLGVAQHPILGVAQHLLLRSLLVPFLEARRLRIPKLGLV